MILKGCARCKTLITYGSTYCDTCKLIVEAERAERHNQQMKAINQKYNRKRDPKYSRFYNSDSWRMMAARRLQDDKFRCRKCGEIAAEVDHIVPIQTPEGWERRLDYENTQALCLDCHNEKHNRFKKKRK